MAKGIFRGFAKPDDPIYSGGLVVGGKRFPQSTKTSVPAKDEKSDNPKQEIETPQEKPKG